MNMIRHSHVFVAGIVLCVGTVKLPWWSILSWVKIDKVGVFWFTTPDSTPKTRFYVTAVSTAILIDVLNPMSVILSPPQDGKRVEAGRSWCPNKVLLSLTTSSHPDASTNWNLTYTPPNSLRISLFDSFLAFAGPQSNSQRTGRNLCVRPWINFCKSI